MAADKKREIGAEQARQGVISGRVILVLAVSLTLAGFAMWYLIGYYWPGL